ncbi:DUF3347 domain-containing protein [Flammeovirga kamogawensis]|uniref:DUF3347 domain-containing protein n=1 Tax=Flammeovirga kamogawensis TaxID=373891 RepID=A0ABX8GY76_9BACT|nr:DUF3347 domain-containing protein [Flammeovirga kamogawensis]MBB6461324.1 hypothetical protein [Flammeovirga kamogawensis]QWG07880.1 DUF3347 domain-containing protein [Flammeovirga kamogawensis]TRX69687.1 DUF3347 domain-containing protein [Flammeovirga kamogawensis]
MKKILIVGAAAFLMMSCGAPKTEQTNKVEEKVELKPVVYNAEKAKGAKAYLKLSECLIASNPTAAQTFAKKVEVTLPPDVSKEVKEAIAAIGSTDNLEAQRKSFEVVTAYYTEVAKSGEAGMDLYVVHCPMAFNNTGANWLSGTNEVVNPYFGDKMLHCGRVMETIKGK